MKSVTISSLALYSWVFGIIYDLSIGTTFGSYKPPMNKRTKTLWIPGLTSLTASMTLRFVLQRTVEPEDKLLNHSGLPLLPQVLWLVALVLFGATSAYMSRQAGGSRAIATIAAVFPAAMMLPFWTLFAINMALPSSAQWFGLLSGVLNWVVLPGVALLLGALSYFRAQSVVDWKTAMKMNRRTATVWLPALFHILSREPTKMDTNFGI